MLTIEHHNNKYKISFKGIRFSIVVTAEEIPQVLAHYYRWQSHTPSTCPVCKK